MFFQYPSLPEYCNLHSEEDFISDEANGYCMKGTQRGKKEKRKEKKTDLARPHKSEVLLCVYSAEVSLQHVVSTKQL